MLQATVQSHNKQNRKWDDCVHRIFEKLN